MKWVLLASALFLAGNGWIYLAYQNERLKAIRGNTRHFLKVAALGIVVMIIGLVIMFYTVAFAQEQHDRGHLNYQNWVNKDDKDCCNNQDCGSLASVNERNTDAGTVEVRIENEWCPVLAHHYLKRGNAPDWSTSHVCVRKQYEGTPVVDACERLLCYQPRPSS
jgi:hypothetical protein